MAKDLLRSGALVPVDGQHIDLLGLNYVRWQDVLPTVTSVLWVTVEICRESKNVYDTK